MSAIQGVSVSRNSDTGTFPKVCYKLINYILLNGIYIMHVISF